MAKFLKVLLILLVLQLAVVGRVYAAPTILSYIVTLRTCDSAGNAKDVFGPAEFVYACGDGYAPGEEMTLRVIPNGKACSPVYSVFDKLVKADSLGRLRDGSGNPIKLTVLAEGEYDLWADRDSDGMMDVGSPKPEPVAGLGSCMRGFLVVPEFWLGTVMGLAGCFGAFGAFRLLKRKNKNT